MHIILLFFGGGGLPLHIFGLRLDISIGILTRYGPDGPCWPWGLPSLLYHGNQVISGVKNGRGMALTIRPVYRRG